jgi:uncharacterized phage protein (TIGR02220 family)
MASGKTLKFFVPDGEWRELKEMLYRYSKYASPHQSAKFILMELAEISRENPGIGPIQATMGQGRPKGCEAGPDGQCPSPAPARARSISGEKEEEKSKKESKPKKADPSLAPMELTVRILDDLNKLAGTNYQARGVDHRRHIAARLKEDWEEEDFYVVNDKKCFEWLGTDNERYLQPSTLYGNKFAKYHGQKRVGPKKQMAFTEGEKRSERFQDRRETDYESPTVITEVDPNVPVPPM